MIEYVKSLDKASIGLIILFVIMGVIVFIKRESKLVQQSVLSVILEAERKFNTKEGQLKLDYVVKELKLKVPTILRFLITKHMLVSLIEYLLNKFAHLMKVSAEVDITGNDDIKIKVPRVEVKDDIITATVGKATKKSSDFEIYGAIKTETDWRSNPKTSIEVGFEKKL